MPGAQTVGSMSAVQLDQQRAGWLVRQVRGAGEEAGAGSLASFFCGVGKGRMLTGSGNRKFISPSSCLPTVYYMQNLTESQVQGSVGSVVADSQT